MRVLKKNNKFSSDIIDNNKKVDSSIEKPKIVKKKKIGFGKKHKRFDNKKKVILKDEDQDKQKINNIIEKNSQNDKNEQDFLGDIIPDEDFIKDEPNISEKKELWSKSKRKVLINKDMKGKPIFLEDTGEKIGNVFDSIYDKDKNLIGYKIKDNKSDSILSFSLDQFVEDKGGLIFTPSWYAKGVKTIEKLEFKDRISPELNWLLNDRTITEEELYNIFVKHDDIVANYIEDAVALRELLNSRLKILERERITLKEDLMDLTEKRLIKDIDRRKFSEIVMKHRQKVNVLDLNIKKCKELIERLEKTSFGILSRNIINKIEKNDQKDHISSKFNYKHNLPANDLDENRFMEKYNDIKSEYDEIQNEYQNIKEVLQKKIEDPYENKYYDLKNEYNNLKYEFDELKNNYTNDPKDIYKDKYNNIKKEYKKLQLENEKLKESLRSNIKIPVDNKSKDITHNYEQLLKDYNDLSEEHKDLKIAVERLLQKSDL